MSTTQNLELENAQLREEVKNLKKENEKLQWDFNFVRDQLIAAHKRPSDTRRIVGTSKTVGDLLEENEKLEAKIAKFKKILTDEWFW